MAPSATCPTCMASLVLTNHDTFDSWVCPAGHGLAATLSELYERAQEDEIHHLWALAKAAPTEGGKGCPMCSLPMASVTVAFDDDEVDEGADGDGPNTGEVPVDVCAADQVVWFDAAELESLPGDLPDPEPTAEELAKIQQIAKEFGERIVAAERADDGLTDRIENAVSDRITWSPRVFRMFSKK